MRMIKFERELGAIRLIFMCKNQTSVLICRIKKNSVFLQKKLV